MCGIAGFSMNPTSTVNTRALGHELLASIQDRGSDASGYAYVKDDTLDVFKLPTPGSQLPMSGMPRRSDAAILHTRYATQGSRLDNRNNHPVISPDGLVALTHNGVISNDFQFRDEMGGEFSGLAAVDSAVIPALIEKYGIMAAAPMLEGYAAIAWFDSRENYKQTLHIARLDFSPVHYTWLMDGSFVYASTRIILARALFKAGLEHGVIFEMEDNVMLTVRDGVIVTMRDKMHMQEDAYTRWQFSGATAGGHSTTTTAKPAAKTKIGDSFRRPVVFDDSLDDTPADSDNDFTWEEDMELRELDGWGGNFANIAQKALTTNPKVIDGTEVELNTPQQWLRNEATGELELVSPTIPTRQLLGYWFRTEDGGMDYSDTLEGLENELAWYSGLNLHEGAPFPEAPKALRWTNHITDIGEAWSDNTLTSWLDDMAQIDAHESKSVFNLNYVREGVTDLILARGK